MIADPSLTTKMTQERLDLVRPLFGPEVAVAACDPLADPPVPFAEETACLSPRAVEKRRREFAAGRAAAHQAMRDLGQVPRPIVISDSRAPIWPQGLTGSITHTKSCALAAVAPADALRAIGIDVEEDTPLKDDLVPAICSDRERAWLSKQDDPGQMGKLIFSAKEAAYKCQYMISKRFFGFDGMELEVTPDVDSPGQSGRFLARFTADQLPFQRGFSIEGAFVIGAGIIFTMATLKKE
ncbi:4'-phosphopantetheinyl transferase superfamily protein [Phaeobacter sp. PT47_59]|uniref:4'-phosphopantetheinyl transferase family protein n=1 Tax=Phaeobacter sp. PT47_59 TaxID=3029979 RepID=UPI0023809060|nr:4'-phosphopantetheinyl transferase superfamily protein [Phaeobacter sp. PT47_59]MDE4175511.1 4'-phosphopantetheinyl transferase superfamily protein [Phaeobacter sp. PT47_59]